MNQKDVQSPATELRKLLRSESFSGVVAVRWQGQAVLEHAGGFANRQSGTPNAITTRFATASVSKMFTALCLARLVDAGLCRFEQSLVEIVPSLQPHVRADVTLAGLLSHTSGAGDYIDDDAALPFAGMDVARLDCVQAFLPLILEVPWQAPGKYHYSSAGYILLGHAIETLTSKRFPQAVDHWLLQPAGMCATGFPSLAAPAATLAVGYLPDGQPNFSHLPRVGGPDGGIVTTAGDLQRLFSAVESGGLISEKTWRFLSTEAGREGDWRYGHGLVITSAAGRLWHGHTGSDPGISARVAFSASEDSSVVVLCNVEAIAFRVFRLLREFFDADQTALKQKFKLES